MKKWPSGALIFGALCIALSFVMSFPKSTFAQNQNLLLNGGLRFQSQNNSRGNREGFRNGSIPFWEQENYGDAEVFRATNIAEFRTRFPVDGVVVLHPGKSLWQFSLLSEMQLDNGDAVSLSVFGHQKTANALRATLHQMALDNAAGEWSPADFGQSDKRKFPKRTRGELIPLFPATAQSDEATDFELKIENAVIDQFAATGPHVIGLKVEFTNTSDQDVWIYAPSLTKSTFAQNRLPDLRPLPDYYRYIPRTMTKLRRGEALHIVAMGSSIDRGSANPPLYFYDEDPASPHFKEPISQASRLFDGAQIGHPEWTPYFGWWQHYFSYTGRTKLDLMRRYNYPVDGILLNFQAADGSAIGESHSSLREWAELEHAPAPEKNGQASGKNWQELYSEIFTRPTGSSPDLIIFGSGANEKIDGAAEVAAFEGAIRWFQRHYPGVEFVFCMWNSQEKYTPNDGMLKDLAQRYGIPYIDVTQQMNLATRQLPPTKSATPYAPEDGHPQAAAHYIWGQFLQRAFQSADPTAPGIPQQYLPERLTPVTIGWEGDINTYLQNSPRLHQKTAFILDDAMVNLWANGKAEQITVLIDGQEHTGSRRKPATTRDPRNSTFATGFLTLGDRHLIEVSGEDAHIIAVDSKAALNRTWHGVEAGNWQGISAAQPFQSQWGEPFGTSKVRLQAGQTVTLQFTGNACSVAWVDIEKGGILKATIDGKDAWSVPTNIPFALANGTKVLLENRKGILNLPYGAHTLEITAASAPVELLGAFSYDTRTLREKQLADLYPSNR